MQAIVSDIIVNQAVQTGNLQVSQLLQSNSSPQTSFAEMLNSLRNQETEAPEKESALAKSVEDKKPQETDKASEEQKTPKTEKSEEKKDASEVKDNAEKKDVSKTDKKSVVEGNEKKVSFKEESGSKQKLLNNERLETVEKDGAKKSEIKTNQKTADTKDSKKFLDEKNLNNAINEEELAASQLTENAAALQNASTANVAKSDDNAKVTTADNDALEIQTENVSVNENQNDVLQNKLTADEKVYSLDKESKIIVHDQRTEQTEDTKPSEKSSSKNQVQVQYDNQNNATITMELAEQNASENILSLDNQTAASEGSNFQAMLSNQIQANAPEFVKAGSLILQDNNKGTINLVLHPDDLGNVKIHLSMDGKTVSAHITVNTKEALEVFKDNAQTLREAFAKNGFDTAGFDVSYNGSSSGQDQNQTFEGRYDGTEYWARNAYGDSLGGETDGYIPDSYEFAQNSEYSINIVA